MNVPTPEPQQGPQADPGKPDPVTEAEVAVHHAAYDDPRSYDAKKAWREAYPDQPSTLHHTGSGLGALLKALEPEPEPEAER